MKNRAKNILSVLIALGGMAAVGMLFILLFPIFPPFVCGLFCLTCVSPILLYANVKKAPKGSYRCFCNLVGGALTVPMLYLLIYSGIIGCIGLGLTICKGNISSTLNKYLLLVCLVLTVLTVLCGMLHARRVKVVRYQIKADVKKPVKIAFFSDTHIGAFSPAMHIQKIVSKIKKEEPDLVLFGGDLLDLDVPKGKKASKITALLSSLGGIIACEGNHDLHERSTPEQCAFLEDTNVTLLRDSIYTDKQSGLIILGRQSSKAPRADLPAIASEKIDILLDHDPKYASEALALGVPLVLCGHTHKGQTFPGNLLRRFTTSYFYGCYTVDGAHVITTAGCGSTGLAVRSLITNEIVIINIVPDK